MHWFFKISLGGLCLLLLLVPVLGQDLDSVVAVSPSVSDDTLTLTIQTQNKRPQVSAFFLTGPDRLVVEVNDARPMATLPTKPRISTLKSWNIKPAGLNRSRITLNLDYRPPASKILVKTFDSPPRAEIVCPLKPLLVEKLKLTSGIQWIREDKYIASRWTRLNRLVFDPADPDLEVVIGLAQERSDTREPLTTTVKRYKAVAGINGGFFAGGGGALGLIYRDGQMIAPHVSRRPPRSGFGLTLDNVPLFGRLAAKGSKIHDLDGGDWSKARLALGGGPRLLKRGLPAITADLEELGPKGNDITRVAARTVVGADEKGQLVFATITGYNDNHSQGAQFGPLVEWLKSVGVKDAVNFDGGASVDMVIGGSIVSDGPGNVTKEKPVATSLLIKDKRPRTFPQKAEWHFEADTLPADGSSKAKLEIRLKTESGDAVPDGISVRFFGQGITLEPAVAQTQNGKVVTTIGSVRRPGQATISLSAGPLTQTRSYSLISAPPSRLVVQQVEAVPVQAMPAGREQPEFQRVTLRLQTLDEWGNFVAGAPFSVGFDNSNQTDFESDEYGMGSVEVDLPSAGGKLLITHTGGELPWNVPALETP